MEGRAHQRQSRPALQRRDLDLAQRQDLTQSLPKIEAPTLFVTGSEHPEWTPQLAREASRLLRNGSAAAVDKAAYLLPLETPQEFGALVRQFWAANAGRPGPA